jgi:lysophospholipase L1-like esterase
VRYLLHSSRRWLRLTLLSGVMFIAACSANVGATTQSGPLQSTSHQYRLTYVAIGASDAYGVGTSDPDRTSWPTELSNAFGPDVHLINLGIPGATVAQALQDELPIAQESQPDVITVWLAVNDLVDHVPLATYSQQLQSLLSALRQHTHARIFVGNVPDLTLLPFFSNDDLVALATQVREWNSAIAATCVAAGAHLVDLFSQWNELADHPEYISDDGLHPSNIGALRLAEIFAQAIQSAGGT